MHIHSLCYCESVMYFHLSHVFVIVAQFTNRMHFILIIASGYFLLALLVSLSSVKGDVIYGVRIGWYCEKKVKTKFK